MIKLIDQMKDLINNALENGCPCVLATAAPDGEPDIGFKGSMMVFDDESLAYWERTKRQHLKNITANPKVVVLFRDGKSKAAWRFHGLAEVHEAGAIRDQVMARTVSAELGRTPIAKAQLWSSSSIRSLTWPDRFYKAASFCGRSSVPQHSGSPPMFWLFFVYAAGQPGCV
jgi:hypothetical protein